MLIFQQKVWIGHMNLGGAATQDEGTCSGALPIHMVDGTMWLLISWLPRNGYRPWKASILILYQHLFSYPIIHTSISFIWYIIFQESSSQVLLLGNWTETSGKARSKALQDAPPRSLSDHLFWGKPAATLWGHSSSPNKEPMEQGREASCQWPCGGTILEMDPPAPIEPLDDYSPDQHLDCGQTKDPELEPPRLVSCSWILNPQKLWDNKC